MYKELLENYSQNLDFVKIQPPATRFQIFKAEFIVGHSFPKELKELLFELNGDKWLLFSTADIIDTVHRNRKYLKGTCPNLNQHIFFAGNGCGDYYCYNVSKDNTVDINSIFMWEHETNETHKVASNIAELIKRYYSDEL